MQDTQFATAIRPLPVCILKLPMRIYSLSHELFLLREKNAFLVESYADFSKLPINEQIFALNRAVWICSSSHAENESPFLIRLKSWIIELRNRKLTREDYTEVFGQFWNYLSSGRNCPRLSKKRLESGEKPSRGIGAPLLAQIFQFVLSLPEIQRIKSPRKMVNAAWNFNFSAALWRYFVSLEAEGCVQIENYDEQETRTSREKIEREYNDAVSAWKSCADDEMRAVAIGKFPLILKLARLESEVSDFNKRKEAICPA